MSGENGLDIAVAPASTSLAGRVLTLGVPLLVLVSAWLPRAGSAPSPSLLLIVVTGVAAGLALLFWIAPRRLGYALSATELILQHLSGQTRLPLAALAARRTAGRLGWRTFGTGLPGYLSGHFTFGPDQRSAVFACASRPEAGVIVEQDGKAYFLTPADPDAFLAELAKRGATVTR